MERQSSRRRKAPPKESLQVSQNRRDPDRIDSSKLGRSRCTGIIVYPLVVCLLIILAYLHQSNTPDPLRSPIPSRILSGSLTFHDSDSARPRIQLHPENHAYRQPVTQHLDWLVTSDHLRPDGVLKRIYLANGSSLNYFALILIVCRTLSRPNHRGSLWRYSGHSRHQCSRRGADLYPLAWFARHQ